MAGCEGGSWEGVSRKWTIGMFLAMADHWKYNGPPAYIGVAAYLKLTKKRPRRRSMKSKGAVRDFMRMFSAVGGSVNK
jgi:hypothetical protein